MTVETNPNYPSDLDSATPAAGDLKAEGDDHLRNLKRVLKTTLPNVTGAITPTHTQLNTVPDLAPKASPALTGIPTAPTAAVGTGTTQIATTAFVAATALVSALPGQTGNSGKFVTTDGTNASWADAVTSVNGASGAVSTLIGDHAVVVHTGNGHGSSSTKIRRFTTTLTNVGTAITYADSATLGGTFTINETAMYAISYDDGAAATGQFGASVNSAQLTTNIETITAANRLGSTLANTFGNFAITAKLTAGDVIRPHTDGAADNAGAYVRFSIRKVGNV